MKTLAKAYEQTVDECLKEMFKRVGETYPNKKLTSQEKWYTKRTWTEKEEEDLKMWRIESKYWNKVLNSFHLLMTQRYRENKLWQEMIKLREAYIKELEKNERK